MAKFTPDDLAGWLALAPVLMQLLDYVVGLIERLFGSKSGEEKQAKALALIKTVAPGMPDGELIPDETWKGLIDNHVSLLNESGLWKHAGGDKREKDLVELVGY